MMSMSKLMAPLCGVANATPALVGVSKTPALAGVAGNAISKRYSSTDRQLDTPIKKAPKRSVFISQSDDVFANLAFEAWVYKNWNFEKRNVLFLWRNSPCVVIGRHQNPLVEANLPYLSTAGVPVARRQSGGGTVYHDPGNLNCTFFTARDRYNRRENLDIICKALREDFGIEAEVNKRDDIIVEDQYKVSGSAAKLGRTSAYHHCSLLVKADKMQLKLALKGDKSIKSSATASLPSPVVNLSDLNDSITVDQLLTSLGRIYLQGPAESEESSVKSYSNPNGYTLINPTDDWFPGLGEMQAEMSSYSWLHNKTPRFTITRPVTLPECVAHDTTVNVTIQSYHGYIEEVKVEDDVCPNVADLINETGRYFKRLPYTMDVFRDLSDRMRLPQPLKTRRYVA